MNNKIEKGGFYQITFTDLNTLKDFLKYKKIHAFQLRYDSLLGHIVTFVLEINVPMLLSLNIIMI
tara:strand:- start:111 stop:305 length:195 start_codon:yes stop_codon:yes gene_type:complete